MSTPKLPVPMGQTPTSTPGTTWLESPFAANLKAFLGWLLPRHASQGGVTEVRILGQGTLKGVWSAQLEPGDETWLANAIQPDADPGTTRQPRDIHPCMGNAGFYFVINPVRPRPELKRHFRRVNTASRDADVLAYSLLMIDIDPVRVSRQVPASKEERAAARAVAWQVRDFLRRAGVRPLEAMSGNGFHLLVPLIPAYQDDIAQAAKDAQQLLALLHKRFSNEHAEVDRVTFNPARLCKLYGTLSVKGEPSLERPHRFARIDLHRIPEEMDLFARLEAVTTEEGHWHAAHAAARPPSDITSWRAQALARLPLEAVFGSLLTGNYSGNGWLECRDPASSTGDLHPSAGVSDGSRTERGVFHSFRTGESMSVFDFLIRQGKATDFRHARGLVAELSGVPIPAVGAIRAANCAYLPEESMSKSSMLSSTAQRPLTDSVNHPDPGAHKSIEEAGNNNGYISNGNDPATPTPDTIPQAPQPSSAQDDEAPTIPAASSSLEDLAVRQFAERWQQCSDNDARNRVLQDILMHTSLLPVISRQLRLEALRTVTGMSLRVLREALKEARRLWRIKRQDSARAEARALKPSLDWVENRDTVDSLFREILTLIGPTQRFFVSENTLVYLCPGAGPVPLTERNLPGYLSAELELRFLRDLEGCLVLARCGVLQGEMARAFVTSPDVRQALPPLRLYTRSPVFDRDWRFIGTPGYHAESGIYYDGPEVVPCDGLSALEDALADFHWRTPADRVNVMGALLTCLTIRLFGRGHPFVAIDGNKAGVGKTTLAQVVGTVIEGRIPATLSFPPDDAELEKLLATRVEKGERVLILDNLKPRKPISSAVLERCITDARPSFRRLGTNTEISRPENDLLFILTMNLTQLGSDLRRRALPVNLFLEKNVRLVHYPAADLLGTVLEARLRILAELAGLVQRWLEAGRPLDGATAQHGVGQAWARTMDGILRHSGLEGFLSNMEASERAYDPRYALMLEVAQQFGHLAPATSTDWVERLKHGPLEDKLRDRKGNWRSARACATIVGGLFSDYLDTLFEVDGEGLELERTYPEGPSRSPAYGFKRVGAVTATGNLSEELMRMPGITILEA